MAAELFGALGSLHSAQLPPSRPPPLDSPLPVIANYFSDNPHSARSFLGYLFLLSAVNNAEVTKVEWLLLSFGVDPNRRPGAGEQIELREGRVSLKGLAGESLAWAIEEGALQTRCS